MWAFKEYKSFLFFFLEQAIARMCRTSRPFPSFVEAMLISLTQHVRTARQCSCHIFVHFVPFCVMFKHRTLKTPELSPECHDNSTRLHALEDELPSRTRSFQRHVDITVASDQLFRYVRTVDQYNFVPSREKNTGLWHFAQNINFFSSNEIFAASRSSIARFDLSISLI